jgi:hypothetical protein
MLGALSGNIFRSLQTILVSRQFDRAAVVIGEVSIPRPER